nr:SusD/RagB family nutrient-binding outer membrane lipoprotein [uncultured Carboxylicivirga sp.]
MKKRNIFLSFLTGLAILITSCSDSVMDKINENVNNPEDMESRLILTDAMIKTAFSIVGSDLAFYATIYTEHTVGIWNQFYSAERRGGEVTSSATYNNSWSTIYNNLYNLKGVIARCSEGGKEEGNYQNLGIAQILTAHNLATLTDLWGDVPWTEACQPGIIFTPKLDKQEAIYSDVMSLLDQAIENLEKDSDFPLLGTQDLFYGGDVESWIKFAYGLKARYTLRLSLKNPDYANVLAYAERSFTSASNECKLVYNGSTTMSPFYQMFLNRDNHGASESFYTKLQERNDPRTNIVYKTHPDAGEFVLAPNGNPEQAQGVYAVSAISNITAPTYVLSYHEIEFIKAEASYRLTRNSDALSALKSGITAAMNKVNIAVDEEDINSYLEEVVEGRFTANGLEEIMVQKYLAFFEEEAVEAYSDIRRLVAMGNNVIKLENENNNTVGFPECFTYGSSDVTTNPNVADAYGNGSYVFTRKVWWAGGE